MRNLPFFTTQLGVASLTLCEIPYTQKAYIRIQDTQHPKAFLQECIDFCKAAGAQWVYAAGHCVCEAYPEHTKILKMTAQRDQIGQTDACLFPVTESTLSKWVEIYNHKISAVPNGAWMTQQTAQKLLNDGNGYFVHRNGKLLGTGIADGDNISWVASLAHNAGKDVVRALCNSLTADSVCLTVASENHKAVALYQQLGFLVTGVESVWYCVYQLSIKNT